MTKFNQVTFAVADLEKSVAFYRDKLGLQVIRRQENPMGKFAFMGADGQVFLELIEYADPAKAASFVGFGVDDAAAVATSITGEEPQMMQPNPQIRFCYVQDPDGHTIQLAEHPQS